MCSAPTLCPRFVGYASSPHFVPTLCRMRKRERQKRIRPGLSSSSPVLPCLPVLPVLPVAGDGYRQVATGAMTIAESCPSVARTFLSARHCAGRQECLSHTARSITAASRDGFALPRCRVGVAPFSRVSFSRLKKESFDFPGTFAVAASARAGSRGRKRVRVRALKTACAHSAPGAIQLG